MTQQRGPFSAVQFTKESAERVARVVRRAETTPSAGVPLSFRKLFTDNKKSVRICTFTGTWSKNSSKTVTFKSTTSTPNTAVAQNIFVTISGTTATTTKNCAIAKDGTAWYLIAAECS